MPPFPTEYLSLPDEELATQFWVWWVAYHVEQRGIPMDCITPELMGTIQNIRVATLGLDTDNEAMASLEKIFRLLANESSSNRIRAARMIRDYFSRRVTHLKAINEATNGRQRQRAIARKPRPDGLQSLIVELMQSDCGMTEVTLLNQLRKREHIPPMKLEINDNEQIIEWMDKKGRARDTSFSSLKDRMSRARKKLRSR